MLFLKYLLFLGITTFSLKDGQSVFTPPTGSLLLQVKNITNKKGCIRIAMYKEENHFLKNEHSFLKKMIPIDTAGTMEIVLPNLQYGQYAIAIYHDANNNDKLDKNIFGIPKEPYGFSNNPKAKWRAPKFHETSVQLDQAQKKLNIDLKRWKNW